MQIGCFLLLLVGLYVIAAPILRPVSWVVDAQHNACHVEARAWRDGRLNLDRRYHDTAVYNGKVYSHFPPLFSFISWAAIAFNDATGGPEGEFPPELYILLVGLLPVAVGYWAFSQVLDRPGWAALLTGCWIVGTPLLPVLSGCHNGGISQTNQVLAGMGLMLIGGDLLGRRRIWPAAIGLLIGMLTRQTTVFFALPALWLAWRATPRRWWRPALVAAAVALAGATLLTLNQLKFDDPFQSGYVLIYEGREEGWFAQRALTHGVFSPHFIGENLWYMNLAPPDVRWTRHGLIPQNDPMGVSIWITCPLLLFVFLGARDWFGDPSRRGLMLASAGIIAVLMVYHSTGADQPGYYRYALDYVPVWLLVIAPHVAAPARRGWTLAAIAWSTAYFHFILSS
jgi:hypothetical protein